MCTFGRVVLILFGVFLIGLIPPIPLGYQYLTQSGPRWTRTIMQKTNDEGKVLAEFPDHSSLHVSAVLFGLFFGISGVATIITAANLPCKEGK